jgi:glycopeptide antibiotics resistance protein
MSDNIRSTSDRSALFQPTHVWTLILVGWILLIIVLCSFPWWVESPRWGRVRWIPLLDVLRSQHRLRDAILNCFLYIPLGFAYARVRAVSNVKLIGEAALVGLVLSVTCELYQVFSPVRFPTMTDVLMNTIGALAGASFAVKSLDRLRAPKGDRLLL